MSKPNPTSRFHPDPKKLPRHLETYSDEKRVFWSFALYDPEIMFPSGSSPEMNFCNVGRFIKATEQRTWADIEHNRDRDHPIDRDKLAKFARDRLTELQIDDYDIFWSIHFNGKCRLWGIREGSLFQILWLDPNHEVCPSRKKRT